MSMSHCVPVWDGPAGELDAVLATADCVAPVVKGKFGPLPPKNVALVQNSYEVPSQWTVDESITRNSNPEWQGVCIDDWPSEQNPGDAVTPSKPPFSSSPCKEGCLAVDVPVLDITMNNDPDQDDEMVSWLQYPPQYPLDATLERNYCTEFFGQLPDSNMSNLQSLRDSFVGQSTISGRQSRTLATTNAGGSDFSSRAASADAAMAQGAGRAAGVLPQTGVEAFTKVRTTMQYQGTKWSPSSNPSANPVKSAALPTSLTPEARTSPVVSSLSSSLLPPSYQSISLQSSKAGPMNFPHFSGPAAKMKANLQGLGMSHAGVNVMKTPATGSRPFDVNISSGTSLIESSTTRLASGVSDEDANVVVQDSGTQMGPLGGKTAWPAAMQNPRPSEAGGNAAVDHTPADDNLGDEEKPPSPLTAAPEAPGTDQSRFKRGEVQDRPEPTLISSPGTSRNSSDKGKGFTARGKRRVREDESECQSDDAEEEVAVVDDLKKPQPRGPTMKRTRAAEVHNLSERRRRDRINERMKALQELIPNSNKADKASMLDEAIEYLKMLQVQLQMMSMRSGLGIPSLIPTGLQHLQMGAMPPLGISMGMGLGMGMAPMVGMGMGVLDMNSLAAGRPSHLVAHPPHGGPPLSGSSLLSHSPHGGSSFNVPQMVPLPAHGGTSYGVSQLIPHPSHGVPPHTLSATSPAVSLVDSQDTRLRSSSPAESVYLARQRNLHMNPQTVYNPYVIHNQQQQLQHQQEHQHQPSQQQQHQPNPQNQQQRVARNSVPGGGSQ